MAALTCKIAMSNRVQVFVTVKLLEVSITQSSNVVQPFGVNQFTFMTEPVVQCKLAQANPNDFEGEFNCEIDCRFYVCTKSDEVPQRRECDSGLHFNSRVGACDRPENANCPVQGVSVKHI